MQKLVITAYITVILDSTEFMLKALNEMVDLSKKDDGCLRYELYIDAENPLKYLIFEEWASEVLWKTHMQQDHIKNFKKSGAQYIENINISRYLAVQ